MHLLVVAFLLIIIIYIIGSRRGYYFIPFRQEFDVQPQIIISDDKLPFYAEYKNTPMQYIQELRVGQADPPPRPYPLIYFNGLAPAARA